MRMIIENINKYKILALLLPLLAFVSACSTDMESYGGDNHYAQVRRIKSQGGTYKIGKPYKIFGTWYYPKEDYKYSEVGIASWYGSDFHNRKTANGEKYDMNTLTAAHRTLPLPSIVKVTNLENGRSLVLRVNDRGPYAKNRIIDISKRGATLLGYQTQGTAKVRVEIMEKESKQLKAALLGNEKSNPKAYTIANKRSNDIRPMQLTSNIPQNASVNKNNKNSQKKQVFVQAGSFSQENLASDLRSKLSKFGTSKVSAASVGNSTFYRVRLGPYYDESDASEVLEKVRDYGIYEAKLVRD